MSFREISEKFDISMKALMDLRVHWGRYREIYINRVIDGKMKSITMKLDYKEYIGVII